MFKKFLFGSMVIFALSAGTAHAFLMTLDEQFKTVARPSTGTTQLDFIGTVTDIPQGFSFISLVTVIAYTSTNIGMINSAPTITFTDSGFIASFFIDSSDELGLYGFAFNSNVPSQFVAGICPDIGGSCDNSAQAYSINIVDRLTVPEPGMALLIGAGLSGLALSRRRIQGIKVSIYS